MSTDVRDSSPEYFPPEKDQTLAEPIPEQPEAVEAGPVDWDKTLPPVDKPRYRNIKAKIIARD